MLNPNSPNSRSLYTSSLKPPPGMVFDEAIATTFSLDPAVLLEAPVYLALMAADTQKEPDPLSVLEAIRKYSKKISVYVQKARIQVPHSRANPVFGFLEEMVIEVTASGGGVFHPKVWAIRFVTPDRASSIYRLVVLTRNMTTDSSWDLSLQLEGTIEKRKLDTNKPLAHFFKQLADLANGKERKDQAKRFADELHRVQWTLPEGFDQLAFYLPGDKTFDWKLPYSKRLVVISPFCKDNALQTLVKHTQSADALIARGETLNKLSEDTLALFSRCMILDEAAEIEESDEIENNGIDPSTGLHAKAYLFETQYYSEYTHVVMGSANATNAALEAGNNIEILVELIGKKNKVGGIDELLSSEGMGRYLIDFDTTNKVALDEERQKAEDFVEKARLKLSELTLSIQCREGTNEGTWALILIGSIPYLEGILSVNAWPITVTPNSTVNILGRDSETEISLGEYSTSSITGLIAFELITSHPDVTVRFVLNLPVIGIPAERNSAILQTVIRNQEGFLRYLLLLLGDAEAQGLEFGVGSGLGRWFSSMGNEEDFPLLEELTRTYSRNPEKLSEISELIRDLSQGNQSAILPDDFLSVWSIFEAASGLHNE